MVHHPGKRHCLLGELSSVQFSMTLHPQTHSIHIQRTRSAAYWQPMRPNQPDCQEIVKSGRMCCIGPCTVLVCSSVIVQQRLQQGSNPHQVMSAGACLCLRTVAGLWFARLAQQIRSQCFPQHARKLCCRRGLIFPIIKQLWSGEASVRDAATLLAPLLGDQDDKVIEPLIQA